MSDIGYLDLYQEMLGHQREHGGLLFSGLRFGPEQPQEYCLECLKAGGLHSEYEPRGLKRRYSWAIPDENALELIAKHSPNGVLEIGAGGGYWAMLLQQRGLDVAAYDPEPPPGESSWHSGKAWTAVHAGDHTVAAEHPTRTLMLCWPSYAQSWAAAALELYQGDTVIYIGEGSGGCTADDRFHALLGHEPYCWHTDDDGNELDCPQDCASHVAPLFEEMADVEIPQWAGLHDRLMVYRRLPRLTNEEKTNG